MYLTASKVDSENVFSNWKGRTGKFIRTFGLNTKRNSNEWKVSWESIKRHINTAINRPGIEFEKCQNGKCDLDHVEAETFDSTIEKQKPFERTNIIDYILNEEDETVDLIHEVHDDEFFEKVKSGEIQYVSAMVWPASGGYTIHGKGRVDLPIVDAEQWKFVHHAFLKDNPAYGKDTAIVKTTCEGENCQMQMLSAKQHTPSAFNPLADLPIMVKHQNEIHLVSASKEIQDKIMQRKDTKINDKIIVNAHSTTRDKSSVYSSFKACTCSTSVSKMTDSDNEKTLELKLKASEEKEKEMEAKLKANDEESKKEMESKSKSSRAKYSKLFAAESDEDSKKMYAKLTASTDDKDELKAMEEGMEDSHSARKSSEEDPKIKDMKARLQAMESKNSEPMIASLVALRKGKMPEAELNEFERGLSSKSYKEVEYQHANELYLINSLSSSVTPAKASTHYPFNGSETTGLKASTQSLEEIAGGNN